MQKQDYENDKLTTLKSNHIRLIYININGIESVTGNQSVLQLCQILQIFDVDMISLTQINVYWKRAHVVSSFERTLKKTW